MHTVVALTSVEEETTTDVPSHQQQQQQHVAETDPADAVLFPIFVIGIGVFVYLILSRWVPWMPYTAVMFALGACMAVAIIRLRNDDLISASIVDYWINIDGELLLVVFLPGLIFKDAFELNVHLFEAALWQCVVFAFPMVLAGTALTALVAFYIFPYGWSLDLCLTFGAILSATDPVAVAALLNEVGAPPRLKVHISGEALLNDGSAIVFFTIFSERFLALMQVPGIGEEIDWATGVEVFVQMALGGAGVGVLFAMGTLGLLSLLRRRLAHEENIMQVATTAAMAYLCYFTSEIVFGCSGVIATFTLGNMVRAFGRGVMNDWQLMEDFWGLIEHFLNTVLFTLGGLVCIVCVE